MSDLRQYAQDLFKKAGVSEEKTKAFMEALGDDAVQKAFKDGFVETPQYHSNLDKLKGEYEPRVKAANDRVAEYDKWYREQAQPAMTNYQTAALTLKKYEDTYGPIESNTEARRAAADTGLTKQQVDEMLKQRDQAYVGLSKDFARASMDHLQRFKEPLDMDAVEKLAIEKSIPFMTAYKEFVAPKEEEMRSIDVQAKLKAAREEGYRDAASKHHIPVDTKPKEEMGFWDRKTAPKDPSGRDAERASRDAFFQGWNNPEPAEAAK